MSERAREVFDEAVANAERGLLEDAIEGFASVPNGTPHFRAAAFNQAVLLARKAFLSDAIKCFEQLGEPRDNETETALQECIEAEMKGGATACINTPLRRVDSDDPQGPV
jgi:hypothetical protein